MLGRSRLVCLCVYACWALARRSAEEDLRSEAYVSISEAYVHRYVNEALARSLVDV